MLPGDLMKPPVREVGQGIAREIFSVHDPPDLIQNQTENEDKPS
jgi:hypothetical protein